MHDLSFAQRERLVFTELLVLSLPPFRPPTSNTYELPGYFFFSFLINLCSFTLRRLWMCLVFSHYTVRFKTVSDALSQRNIDLSFSFSGA